MNIEVWRIPLIIKIALLQSQITYIDEEEEKYFDGRGCWSNWKSKRKLEFILTNKEKIEFLTRFIDSIKIFNDKGNVKVSEIKF